ncbi:hypothetical protein AMATHDRAFT_64260 [Amanita thiersii Skay4041]|uniref:Uncharacterized protein n=1 Tax=Amanita thiersii Skay4041 TaxID=703135 RepID=A0A2A9ND75_9AGAR|nr:hypothetical protein AMATHDRAFT_64260 [Amanita thiersii Skay4041]
MQWEGDPLIGCIGLKDWPPEWYKGKMSQIVGVKGSQREIIALEFYCYQSNDEAFLAAYS